MVDAFIPSLRLLLISLQGIVTVAIYSEADAEALHVKTADRALPLGGLTAADSYLCIDRILALAVSEGVQAIHPGYGFLSENAKFAQACAVAGIVFIGPSEQHIAEFGLKHRARELAELADVPRTMGSGLLPTIEDAVLAAEMIGYPVMLKNTGTLRSTHIFI